MNVTKTSPRPVPIPARRRWQILCTEWLPLAVFVGCVLLIVLLWQKAGRVPTLVAEVELIRAEVRSTQAGKLTGISVQPFQHVRAGDVVAHVLAAEPAVAEASVAKVRAEIDYLRTSLEPLWAAQRVDLDRERLRLDWMKERVALASVRAQLHEAEATLARLGPLHQNRLVADEQHERALNLRNALAQQVTEQTRLVETIAAPELPATVGDDGHQHSSAPAAKPDATLRAALRVQEEALRLLEAQLAPVRLLAPADGVVSLVHRREGETILPGEPVVTITAAEPTRIVGYVRQPLTREPRVGMPVELRPRNGLGKLAVARVTQVARALEPISATLLTRIGATNAIELGLRVEISLPPELGLRSGEQVEVWLRDE